MHCLPEVHYTAQEQVKMQLYVLKRLPWHKGIQGEVVGNWYSFARGFSALTTSIAAA
jgi:hypothetical protein